MALNVLAFNCSLKPPDEASSTDLLLSQILDSFKEQGAEGESIRLSGFNIKPGVRSDEGAGDDWPALRAKILESDIFILGTPIWLGHPSSICQRVLERLDAFLGEKDEKGRMVSYGIVAGVAVTGNEDGAHHVSAELYQGLNDVGFTLAANAVSYWVGEAMGKTDFKDLNQTPDKVRETTALLTRNAVHLAHLLKRKPYPGAPQSS